MPGPPANEQTRKVVGLALVRRGNVPIHIPSRASPDPITFCNVAGTVESWMGSGRRKHSVQDCLRFWVAVDTTDRKDYVVGNTAGAG